MGSKKKEFYLEDVRIQNQLFPRTFLIPNQQAIDNLQVDALVKLIFVMEKAQEDGCGAERMWVRIIHIQNGLFTGVLDNHPYYMQSIKYGDEIQFESRNIATIYGRDKSVSFNEKQFAIITKRALENKQVNWAIKTDDLCDDEDSGWQLFYGDESPSYLDDSSNATLVTLEQVLSFEPLLERVFGCSRLGYGYEYSKESNQFVEVEE